MRDKNKPMQKLGIVSVLGNVAGIKHVARGLEQFCLNRLSAPPWKQQTPTWQCAVL
jgi:hypothetical protein